MQINLPLQEFINYFSLRKADGAIVFQSNIVFHFEGVTTEKNSEVHIVTINEKQFIYLIDMDNTAIPTQFDTEQNTLSYIPTLCLRIDKHDDQSVILIFPKK